MKDTPSYEVFSRSPKKISEKKLEITDVIPSRGLDYFWDAILPDGCLTIIGCGIIAAIISSLISFEYFLLVFIAVIITSVIFRISKAQNKNREIATSRQIYEHKSIEEESRNLSRQLNNTIVAANQRSSELPINLKDTSEHLKRSRQEFVDRAFGPFWDEVEKAIMSLGKFTTGVRDLTESCNSYAKALKNRKHNFPNAIIEIDKIPDHKPSLVELQKVIRMGQTDFEFATIWEHRRTRKVLISGFRTLEDAIGNIGNYVETSYTDLQKSVSHGVSSIVEEQKKMRFRSKEP